MSPSGCMDGPTELTSAAGLEKRCKVMLVIAYDGTAYQGWQTQKTGVGVQQRVEEALARIVPGAGGVASSSRTDSGVHALGMVVHFEVPAHLLTMPMRRLPLSLNAFLPRDIRVISARRVPLTFNARFDAAAKQYRYWVWNHSVMNPLLWTRAWHVPWPLDVKAMKQAATFLVGCHDFRSFATTHPYEIKNTVRTLRRLSIHRQGALICFVLEADGFLYKMCRGLVGTLVQLGRGKFGEAELRAMLAARDRRAAGVTAPPEGLVLWKVFYPRQPAPARKPQ